MPALFALLTALAAAQPATQPLPVSRGRAFISPMGEPFHTPGKDALVTWFQQADTNHDGALLLDEMQKDAQRFFLTLDTNHDGEVDPDEVDHYENVIAPEVRIDSGWGMPAANDEGSGGGRLGVLNIPEPVVAADTNLDRGVSAQEFQVAAEKRFGLLDLNHDGRLTLDELDAARSAARSNARRSNRQEQEIPSDTTVAQPSSDDGGPGG